MKEPWPKTHGWPRQGKRGSTWQLGFRDHDGKERSRSFRTKQLAQAWKKAYVEAERHSRLREFLLGTDAPEVQPDDTPLAELIAEWLVTDAHPELPNGMSPAGWGTYRSVASRHILGNPIERHLKKTDEVFEVQPAIPPLGEKGGYAVGHLPVTEFTTGRTLIRWVKAMRDAGVSKPTETKAWTVMSAALSWAVEDERWPVETNGCLIAARNRGTRRYKSATAQAERDANTRKQRANTAAWALSPLAVERIRIVMLERIKQERHLFAVRDATAVAIQYGLGMRNQEIWALSFGDLAGNRARVREVIASGKRDTRGKTEQATGSTRNPPIDKFLKADLRAWVRMLDEAGFPTGPTDFVLRGDLAGFGATEGHMSASQIHSWGTKYFTPAANVVAKRWPEDHGDIIGATPYSLRRGMISLRIRAGEDRQVIAEECGTSVQMLEDSYSFVIKELKEYGPRPVLEERQRAREIARC